MMRNFLFFQISSVTANVWGFNRSQRPQIPTLEIQPTANFTDKVFYPKSVLQKISKVKSKIYFDENLYSQELFNPHAVGIFTFE